MQLAYQQILLAGESVIVLASHSCGVLNCSRLKGSYITIYHMETSDQELSIGLGQGPSSSPTELNTRPSRITQKKSTRYFYKPKVQWGENMKIALATIVSQEKRNGKGWMSRAEARWKNYFPMYDMLNMKNLRDRHAKLSNDIIRVAEEGGIGLNVIVNEEAEQYEKATRVHVQGVIDNTNESNSGLVKGHDEQTGEENEKENSENIVYRLTEGERTLLQQAMYWKERTVMERNKIIFEKKPTAGPVKHMNETVGDIVQSKEGTSLWEIDCLLYAAQINVAEQNKQNTSRKVLTGRRKKSESLDNPNTKEILNLRKWMAWIANILEMRNRGQKLTEKQKNNLHRIKRKYHTSKTSKSKE